MTIKAYRSTRYNTDRMPRQHKAQPKRTGSFWGVTWQLDDVRYEWRRGMLAGR